MYFLCQQHRSQLIRLPQDKLSEYWLNWILQAGEHYEEEEWGKAIPFAGAAVDLSSSALQRTDVNRISLVTEATLATLYVTNMLAHSNQLAKAHLLADFVSQKIIVMMYASEKPEWCECCLDVINDPRKHYDFFTEYMSLPYSDCKMLSTFCA